MTNIARLELSPEAYARITDRQRAANIAAEGQPVNVYAPTYEQYRAAWAKVHGNEWHSVAEVHKALGTIRAFESAIPGRETPLETLKAQGVRPVLAYALITVAVGYAALLGWFALVARVGGWL